jgi:hypothetical protein
MDTTQIKNGPLFFMENMIRQFEIVSLYTACHFDIFDFCEHDFKSAFEIKENCKFLAPLRNILDMLDLLHSKGYLIREGLLEDAKYKTYSTELLKSNPENIIPLIEWTYKICNSSIRLPEALLKGNIWEDTPFIEIYDSDKMVPFLRTMALLQRNNFQKIAEVIDFSKFKTCIDVGGCLGEFSINIKKAHNHLNCFNFDLPPVEKIFNDYVNEKQMTDQIKFLAGDFFKDDFPKSDVFAMGNILHDWNEEKKLFLMKKTYEALNDDGIFIIVEHIIDQERKENIPALAISLAMMVECSQGFNSSFSDIERWAKQTGFSKVEKILDSVIVCYK